MTPILIASAVVLAISLISNFGLTYVYLGARDDVTQAEAARDTASSAATTCSASVDDLTKAAKDQQAQATQALAAAEAKARTRNQRADAILSRPATVPGNDCKSAGDRASEWLKGRK